MEIRSIIEGLGKQLNISKLSLNASGVCRLVIDERLVIDIEADEINENVRLVSVIGSISEKQESGFYEELLYANFSGIQGSENIFGADHVAHEVIMFSRLDMSETDQKIFGERLESFINDVEYWLNKYEKGDICAVRASSSQHNIPNPAFDSRMAGLRL